MIVHDAVYAYLQLPGFTIPCAKRNVLSDLPNVDSTRKSREKMWCFLLKCFIISSFQEDIHINYKILSYFLS